jgi:hypothetical protein
VYFIQSHHFSSQSRLLKLKGYDAILGCDWIKAHNPICLDLRGNSRQLTIYKEGQDQAVFHDFTTPPPQPFNNSAKLEKLCRTDTIRYVIQITNMEQDNEARFDKEVHPTLEV